MTTKILRYHWIILLSILSLFACKDAAKSGNSANSTESAQLQALPSEAFMRLYNECDVMDAIFMELPFSMGQNNNQGVRKILSLVDKVAPENLGTNCPLMGNQRYLSEGELLAEMDFYHAPGCYFFVITYEGKKYYNKMTQAGITFYENLKKKETPKMQE